MPKSASTPFAQTPFIRNHATALTAVTFLIIATTGLMLFFELSQDLVEGLHQWLGILFVAAVGLHLTRNWRPFAGLWRNAPVRRWAVVGLLVSVVFIGASSLEEEGEAQDALLTLVMDAPLVELAAITNEPVADLVARLQQNGTPEATQESTLAGLGESYGAEEETLLELVLN